MSLLDRPRLRPLSFRRVRHEGGDYVACEDPAGSFRDSVLIPAGWFHAVVRHCDGSRTPADIAGRAAEDGFRVAPDDVDASLAALERMMVLDGPAFRAFRARLDAEPVRPAAFAGRSYPAEPMALRASLARHFADERGSGPVGATSAKDAPRLRAILCPHIDFTRGGPTYTWAYRALAERSDADTFFVLGVAHQGARHRYALTRKHFATPLGTAETDRDLVDRIAASAGFDVFEDELAHRTEHSIEFQVVFLQALLGARGRPFRIVPILVGSFHDLMDDGREPIDDPEVAAMVAALRDAEAHAAAAGRSVAYVGGIDLCHVGPEFGDPDPVDDARLAEIRRFDHALLGHAAAGDPRGWFAEAAAVGNRWRVCGLAATYTLLHAIGPDARGRLLRYDQAVDPSRTCCVSFASLVLDAPAQGGDAP